jgi:gliding motility-associated-like protein
MVFIMAFDNVNGSGQINANGQDGFDSDMSGVGTAGIDGAGGGGGGGTVVVRVQGTVSNTLTINANGGAGGDQNDNAAFYNPAYGPGGGGGGGYIAVTAGTPARNANGANNGTTNSSGLTEFPPNGATRGGAGNNNASISAYDITVTNQTICSGTQANLTAVISGTSPGGTLFWYTTQFGSAFAGTGLNFTTPTLVATTTYYVGFCPGHFRVPVTVTISPAININTSGIVITDESCAGNDGAINGITVSGGTGALTYDWNGTPSAGPSISAAAAGSYTLTVTDAIGCSASVGPFTINTGGGPTINTAGMSITNTTCNQSNGSITGITATGTGTLTYDWNGSPSAGADITSVSAGTYTLTVTDGNGCSSSAGPFIISNSGGVVLDTTAFSVTDEICGNSNGGVNGITVTASTGGLSYEWNGIPSVLIDLSGATAGTYLLEVTDGSGCSVITGPYIIANTGGATINNTSVVVTSTSCGQINGSITGITVSGGTAPLTFDWNGNITLTEDTVNIGAGTYTLTVTDATGCITTDGPYTIDPSSSITVSATGIDATCNGYNDGSATASFIGGNGGEVYQWAGGPATANYTNLAAGTYTVIVTDTTGCADTTTVTITEPAPVVASITGNTSVCNGSSTTLTATGGGSYSWSTSDTSPAITVAPTSPTTYTCIVTIGACSDTASISVTIDPVPVALVSGVTSVCQGSSVSLSGSGGTTYSWNTSDTTSSINVSPSSTTTYLVTVSNACGSDTASITVNVITAPTVNAFSDQTILLGSSASISATGATSYEWSPAGGLSCITCANPTASPTSTTTYMVVGTDANGCTDTAYVTITVDINTNVFVPDIFSPDGNGANDLLFVRGLGIEEFTFRVYDRWGQKVFESTSLSEGWDGTFRGKLLNTAVFIYTLDGTYVTGETFSQKGNITLKR